MRRRQFITLFDGAAVGPFRAYGQGERTRDVGVLMAGAETEAFRKAIEKLGWTEDRKSIVLARTTENCSANISTLGGSNHSRLLSALFLKRTRSGLSSTLRYK